MAWKSFAIFATEKKTSYFDSKPKHINARAHELLDELGFKNYRQISYLNFDKEVNTQNKELFIGAYEQGFILCEANLACELFADDKQKLIPNRDPKYIRIKEKILDYYPHGQVLAIVLHSTVKLWGYSLYENGELIRSAAGSADDGQFTDYGEFLNEENQFFEKNDYNSLIAKGRGEDFTLAVCKRYWGEFINKNKSIKKDFKLDMAEFSKSTGRFKSFFTR